jgi:hypothetical protein
MKDSPLPKQRKTGRLTDRRPKIHRLENHSENIAPRAVAG